MAEYLINTKELNNLADSIRAKTGKTEKIAFNDFTKEIDSIKGESTPFVELTDRQNHNDIILSYKDMASCEDNDEDMLSLIPILFSTSSQCPNVEASCGPVTTNYAWNVFLSEPSRFYCGTSKNTEEYIIYTFNRRSTIKKISLVMPSNTNFSSYHINKISISVSANKEDWYEIYNAISPNDYFMLSEIIADKDNVTAIKNNIKYMKITFNIINQGPILGTIQVYGNYNE